MIGVDANVLIRLFTADDPDQYRLAKQFFGARSADDPAFISAVTLAETVWVLHAVYKLSAAEIGECIEHLLDREDLLIEGRDSLLRLFGNGVRPELIADGLIAYLGWRAGCSHTVTFDRRAARNIGGMEPLS